MVAAVAVFVEGWTEGTRLDGVAGVAFVGALGCEGSRYVSLLVAASSADLRIARLVWAVTVAGRRLGWRDDVVGVPGVAGLNFWAGATAAAGARGTA